MSNNACISFTICVGINVSVNATCSTIGLMSDLQFSVLRLVHKHAWLNL